MTTSQQTGALLELPMLPSPAAVFWHVITGPCKLLFNQLPLPCSSQQRPLYEGQYEWVREYTYAVQNEQAGGSHSYVFRFAPDAVRYLDLGTRLTVQKRSKLKDKDSLQSHRFARPAEVGIKTYCRLTC